MAHEKHVQDLAPGHRAQGPHCEVFLLFILHANFILDPAHDRLGLFPAPMHEEPARAFGHVAPHEQDRESKHAAEPERNAPTPLRADEVGVQENDAQSCSHGGADPERPVDGEIDASAQPGGDELVDRRVDRRVFTANAEAGQEAACRKGKNIEGKGSQDRGNQIHRKGDQKHALAAELVGKAAEIERAEHRPADIGGRGPADLRRAQTQRLRPLQRGAERAHHGDLQTVEQPAHTKRDDYAPVPRGPWQPVEPRRDVGADRVHGPLGHAVQSDGSEEAVFATNQEAMKQFGAKMLGIYTGAVLTELIEIGYAVNLFEASRAGPATSEELAERAGLKERYVREWLGAMATGGIYRYDAASDRYELPEEHAAMLTGSGAQNVAPMSR